MIWNHWLYGTVNSQDNSPRGKTLREMGEMDDVYTAVTREWTTKYATGIDFVQTGLSRPFHVRFFFLFVYDFFVVEKQ